MEPLITKQVLTPSINEIVALHLRYSSGAHPLRIKAFAEMVAKTLFLHRDSVGLTITEIAKTISSILNCKDIYRKSVNSALRMLLSQNVVKVTNDKWELTEIGFKAIGSDLQKSQLRTESVIRRHFGEEMPIDQLRMWFLECSVIFFSKFGDRWVFSICRGVPLRSNLPYDLDDLIKPLIDSHGLSSYAQNLTRGFREFILSNSPEDAEQLWSFGQAMFATRLVAANISSDPITTNEISNSVILLDTNVLFVASLEKHQLALPLVALSKALSNLGVSLHFVHSTKEEYDRILFYRTQSLGRIASRFDREVLLASKDHFIRTALARGCETIEDFERFFESICSPPTSLDDSRPISLLDYPELAHAVDNGLRDKELQSGISKSWLALRHREKTTRALEHDASLIHSIRQLRSEGRKAWGLTLDRTLHDYDLKHTGKNDYPLLLSLDVLLQILAVEQTDPDFNPIAFAPLLANIMAYQFEPTLRAFALEDLEWLLDIEERIADLPRDEIRTLAERVNRARLSGKDQDDPEIRLELQRAFQGRKLRVVKDLDQANKLIQTKDDQLKSEYEKRARVESAMRVEIKGRTYNKLRMRFILNFIGKIALASLSVGAITFTIHYFIGGSNLWPHFLGALSIVGFIFRATQNSIPRYRKLDEEADIITDQEVNSLRK
ncbi:MAG: hypothetical protein WD898_02555 [Candidatus Paceibacterota bacterium]